MRPAAGDELQSTHASRMGRGPRPAAGNARPAGGTPDDAASAICMPGSCGAGSPPAVSPVWKRCLSTLPRMAGRVPTAFCTSQGPTATAGSSLSLLLRKASVPPAKACSSSCAGPCAASARIPKYSTSW
eukprot:scaffold3550_cov112-Isochrysis_galbana.AAC.2